MLQNLHIMQVQSSNQASSKSLYSLANSSESHRAMLNAGALRSENRSVADRFTPMSKALNKTGRPVVYSIMGQGLGDPWNGWGPQVMRISSAHSPLPSIASSFTSPANCSREDILFFIPMAQ